MKKEKKIFLFRMMLFTLFACILPFAFIGWRYQLFTKIDKVSLSGWGLLAILIVFLFIFYVVKSIKKGLFNKREWSMGFQIINGFLKVVLPLLMVYFVITAIESSINLFKQALICTIICESIAIPINPLPKWEMESLKEGDNSLVDKMKEVMK